MDKGCSVTEIQRCFDKILQLGMHLAMTNQQVGVLGIFLASPKPHAPYTPLRLQVHPGGSESLVGPMIHRNDKHGGSGIWLALP